MRTTMFVVLVLIAGCSHTPAEVRDRGTRHEFHSTKAARDVALCTARNAEAIHAGFTTTIRDSGALGEIEVLVHGGQDVGTFAAIDISPRSDGGSLVITTLTPNLLGRDNAANTAAKLMGGC